MPGPSPGDSGPGFSKGRVSRVRLKETKRCPRDGEHPPLGTPQLACFEALYSSAACWWEGEQKGVRVILERGALPLFPPGMRAEAPLLLFPARELRPQHVRQGKGDDGAGGNDDLLGCLGVAAPARRLLP